MCSWEGFLDLKNEEYVVSYLLSGQGSASPPACYYLHLGVSVHRRQTLSAQPGVHLSPASIDPFLYKIFEYQYTFVAIV